MSSAPGIGNVLTARASISPSAPTSALSPASSGFAVAEVEPAQPLDPALVAGGDAVEVVLHARRELVVDEAAEVLLEQLGDREREKARDERGTALERVAAVHDRAHDRGVGRRPADAALLERPHERRLGVARRRRGRVTLRGQLLRLDGLAFLEVRQRTLILVAVVVLADLVRGEEAGERDHGARGAELDVLAGCALRGEAQRHGLSARIRHLGGDRALPDQLVERELVAVQLAAHLVGRAEEVAGGTDRLVRLLRVLHLAVPGARLRREVVGAVELRHLLASGRDRRLRERRRVGAHVGDVAVLVQALRDAHRRLRRVAQLAARLLLQRRGAERRSRLARVGLLVLAANRERRVLQPLEQPARRLFVQVREVLGLRLSVGSEVRAAGDALAVERNEARVERARVEDPLEVPVRDLDERDPLALPLDDQPGRDRLHAPRREPLRDLLPEHRRDLVAVEAVEDPSGSPGRRRAGRRSGASRRASARSRRG